MRPVTRLLLLPLLSLLVFPLISATPARALALPAWEWRNEGLPRQASVTSFLAVDLPAVPGLLLAGVYAPESLYASRDGGHTWQIAGQTGGRPGVDGQPVHVLAQTPDGVLWAGTATGLYRSIGFDDMGDPRWARVEAWPTMRSVFALHVATDGSLLAAGNWPALLRVAGLSMTFTAEVIPAPGALLSVLSLADGTLLAGTDGAGLWRSEDGGQNWFQVAAIGDTFVAALWNASWNPALVLARTRAGLFRTQDGGQSWARVAAELEGRADALVALPASRMLLLGMSTGALYASRDDGLTWQPWGAGLPRDGMVQTLAAVATAGEGRLWAGTQHGLYRSDDQGQTWQLHPDIGTPALAALLLTADGALLAGTHDGVVRSENRGRSWTWIGAGLPPRTVRALVADPHTPGRVLVGTEGGGLWMGDDRGTNWTRIGWDGNAIPGLVADRGEPGRLWVRVAFERVYAGTVAGGEWSARWDGMSTVSEVLALAQSPHAPDLLLAGAADGLYLSLDRAATWQRRAPLLDGQSVFFVAVDEIEPSVLYAGATNGLYHSRDGGEHWERLGRGLENHTVTALARHPRQPNVLYAGTKYAGVWHSTDGGATWAPDPGAHGTPDAPLSVTALSFAPEAATLYAATDRGLLVKELALEPGCDDGACHAPTAAVAPAMPAVPVAASISLPRRAPRYGMHTVSANPEMLPLIHAAGFDTVVQLFPWWEIEPTRGQFIWQPWDEAVAGAEYYGLNLVIRLDKHPAWAKPAQPTPGAPPMDLDAYARLVQTVAARYQGRVAGYVIWNEPNLALEWSGLPPDPQAYVALLQTGYAAVKGGDPDALVLAAGLAPTNTRNDEALDDRLFLEAMYAYGAAPYFDVLAAHPYGFGRPPDDPPGNNAGMNMARLEELRAIMVRHGDGHKPVWITEMGWTVHANAHAAWQTVTPAEQAHYWAAALEKIRRDWPWVELITAWNLGGQAHPEWGGYSLLDLAGRPRPAYTALQQAVLRRQQPADLHTGAQPAGVPVLAADAVVHLGDAPHLGLPWVPIYRARNPSPLWEGRVYLRDPGTEPWQLTLRVMQSNFWANVIWVNGTPLPHYLPPEDYSRSWVAYTVPVPAALLRPGPNVIGVSVTHALPLIQARSFAYDEIQMKDVVLQRAE